MMNKQKIITYAGLGIVGLYLITRESDGDAGFLGGGGGAGTGLLPALDTSESSVGESSVINYILPEPETFSFGDDVLEDDPALSKKTSVDALALVESKQSSGVDKNYAGFTIQEMRSADQDFFLSDTFSQQAGLMSMDRTKDIIADMLSDNQSNNSHYETINTNQLRASVVKKKAIESKKAAMSRGRGGGGGGGGSGGYSIMTGENRVQGWKQVGAKKPTAPGQPDRY